MTLEDDARRAILDLRSARLEPGDWERVHAALDALGSARRSGDQAGAGDAVVALSAVAFAGKVQRRMPARGVGAPAVVPTKQTSALPAVGLVCAGLILGVGWSLGGGVVLVACALFAVFIFVVAFAGSRIAHQPRRDVSPSTTVPAPSEVVTAMERVLGMMGGMPGGRQPP